MYGLDISIQCTVHQVTIVYLLSTMPFFDYSVAVLIELLALPAVVGYLPNRLRYPYHP